MITHPELMTLLNIAHQLGFVFDRHILNPTTVITNEVVMVMVRIVDFIVDVTMAKINLA